jgi:6-phosphogluconolactonase (cycloisomerase 2 family)
VTTANKRALYAAVGPTLTRYDIDVDAATLAPRESITLPANIHYVVPHSARHHLYIATSDSSSGSGTFVGTIHHLSAFRIDPASGALTPHGAPIALPTRPIHITCDAASKHILVAFNRPSLLMVFRINADGTLGAEVKQNEAVDPGIFAHQIRITPDDRLAILVTRGNDAAGGKPEDPGSLRVFHYGDGQLTKEVSIAPNGGYGFGPRHLDYHPSEPWIYVSLERQNQLDVFKREGDTVQPDAAFKIGTLVAPERVRLRQAVGTVHVHPNGRFVYVANRADATEEFQGKQVFGGGENSLACFSIDQKTGEPTLIGHAETRGIHCRTFNIDPSGRLLVAAHITGRLVRDGSTIGELPACLSLFRVGGDGKLEFVRKYDIAVGEKHLFWMGIIDY